jgi:hypothetical protein
MHVANDHRHEDAGRRSRNPFDRLSRLPGWALFGLLFAIFALILLAGLAEAVRETRSSGHKSGSPVTHSLALIERCLVRNSVPVSTRIPAEQFIARSALGGSLIARPNGNTVILMFAGSPSRAVSLYQEQAGVAPPRLKSQLPSILQQTNDVVVLWAVGPTQQQAALIGNCLR